MKKFFELLFLKCVYSSGNSKIINQFLPELENIEGGTGDNSSKFEEIVGTVTEVLPNAGFIVQLDNGEEVKAYMSGALRMNYARIFVGDRVTVKRLASDHSDARVVYKYKV